MKKENIFKFVIFDALLLDGENVTKETQTERFSLMKKIFNEKELKNLDFSVGEKRFEFYIEEPKEFESLNSLNEILEKKKESPFPCDGIVITKKDNVYPFISSAGNSKIFKWKPPCNLTLDFKVSVEEKEKIFISVNNKKNEMIKKELVVDDDPLFYFFDTVIVECSYSSEKEQFILVRHRPDKVASNFPFQYNQLFKNVEQNFDFKKFKGLFSSYEKPSFSSFSPSFRSSSSSSSYSKKWSSFVTNLHSSANETIVKKHFSKYFPTSANVLPDKNNKQKCIAFVNFKTENDRDNSLSLNGSSLNNYPIKVMKGRDNNNNTKKWEKK